MFDRSDTNRSLGPSAHKQATRRKGKTSFAERLHHTRREHRERGAVGIQELIIIMVVTGILIGLGVFIFNTVTDRAQSTVASGNLSTVVSVLQELGSERSTDGRFSYAGSAFRPADGATGNNTDNAAGAAAAICSMVDAIDARTSGIKVKPYAGHATDLADCGGSANTGPTIADGDGSILIADKADIGSDPNGVYVTLNTKPIAAFGGGGTLPAGHVARVIVKPDADTTICAVLVRSGAQSGIGYDSWKIKDAETAADASAGAPSWAESSGKFRKLYNAHCPLLTTAAADPGTPTAFFGPPTLPNLAAAYDTGWVARPIGSFDMDRFFSTPVDPGRDEIHE